MGETEEVSWWCSGPRAPATHERIRQLEQLNATLAAEVERMRPVVKAAIKWNETNYRDMKECELALDAIGNACDEYQASKPK